MLRLGESRRNRLSAGMGAKAAGGRVGGGGRWGG